MMKKFKVILWVTILLYAILFFSSYRPMLPGYHSWYYTPEKYLQVKSSIKDRKNELSKLFSEGSADNKKAVLKKVRLGFQNELVRRLFPFWYGTMWTFNGRTEIPGEASIACGYFVTTTLRDMGVNLNRSKLAQVASEEMIKNLVSKKHMAWYNGYSIKEFVKKIQQTGDGVYIIGLDNHTGYIICEENTVWFIHSSGRFPFGVIKENALNSSTLIYSHYKVVGCLTRDERFLKKWLSDI